MGLGWRAAVLAGAGAALGVHLAPAGTWLPGPRRAIFPRLAGIGGRGHVALTFDDGPDPSSTPRFLDVLDTLGARATFFAVGESAARHPGLIAEISRRGHEVAVHGWTHDRPWLPSVRGELRGLRRAAAVIGDLAGASPRWYRPPYGILTGDRAVAASRAGLSPVLWSAWGKDWADAASGHSVRGLVGRDLRGGGTVLLHDTDRWGGRRWRPALDALPGIVGDCRARGWDVGPLAEHWA